jgi:hypothetical protein
MDGNGHRDFAERIMRTMEKLGPDDYEMTIEASMLSTTHWINFALHGCGVTPADEDVQHTYFLTGNARRRYGILAKDMLDALEEIEEIRPMYVRGDVEGGANAAEFARGLLASVREMALAAKPITRS